MTSPPPSSTLFPYTTLFRSDRQRRRDGNSTTNQFADHSLYRLALNVNARELRKPVRDRKSTRLNSSHLGISYAVFCLKKKRSRDRSVCHTDYRRSEPKYSYV